MPFDNTPKELSINGRLERLLQLAQSSTGSQGNWCSCLAHDCFTDPVLVDAGLPEPFWDGDTGHNWWTEEHIHKFNLWLEFFGVPPVTMTKHNHPIRFWVFGSDTIATKIKAIQRKIMENANAV